MQRLLREYRLFQSYPRAMRVLLLTNLIYALVMPITDLFVSTYLMRNAGVARVIVYQLALFTAIPFGFLFNGWLLQHLPIRCLYAGSMLLCTTSMTVMIGLRELKLTGIAMTGVMMGLSLGIYWANRGFLVLMSTDDSNRNYYCGLENFFTMNIGILLPLLAGTFIICAMDAGADNRHAYGMLTGCALVLSLLAVLVLYRGEFRNPPKAPFFYTRFHPLWNKMQLLIILRELVQGYNLTVPAMLAMRLIGDEKSLGAVLSVTSAFSALLLYILGRTTGPQHRLRILTASVLVFAVGALANSVGFNGPAVMFLMACTAVARPMQTLAHSPIQMLVVDTVSAIDGRNKYSYILSQELGGTLGRCTGCVIFLLLAYHVSEVFALRYAVLIVGLLQMLSIWVARSILRGCVACAAAPSQPT